MDNEVSTPKCGGESDRGVPPIEEPRPRETPSISVPTHNKPAGNRQEMSSFERATLRWARAAVVISILAAAFICLQWYEMHSGALDTHTLAEAAKTQAEKMKDMSEAAEKIRQAAEGMVAEEQLIANNAKKSIDASIEASRSDQRAYVTIGRPDGTVAEILWPNDDKGDAGVLVYFQNNGRVPAKFNWGADSPMIGPLPYDPTILNLDKWTDGKSAEFPTNHLFEPMYRAKSLKEKRVTWSGTIYIAGSSSYQGILWDLPKERMTQFINLRMFPVGGKFEYCDGFGKRVCKKFQMLYLNGPYNRFILQSESQCSDAEMQVRHPMPDYEYLPVCGLPETPEMNFLIPSLPKPK